jgi:hypothetical protein
MDQRMGSQQQGVGARAGKRLTLLFIAAGGFFAFFASSMGALMLAIQSGMHISFNLSIFQSHPYLQIFGFLSEFVMGVAYSVIPLFNSKKLPSNKAACVSLATITTANLLIVSAVLSQGPNDAHYLFEASSLLIAASSVIFALETFRMLGRPSRLLGEAQRFMFLSAISFVLIAVIFMVQETSLPEIGVLASGDLFSPGFLYLSLLGFVGSMIYGVQLKTVAFRMTNYRKHFAGISAALQGVSVVFAFVACFRELNLLVGLVSVFFLAAAALFVISIRVLERTRKRLPLGSSVGGGSGVSIRDKIFAYSNICALSSCLWLLFGCLLGLIWLLVPADFSFLTRDSFIHSIAIGFIGSAIIYYAPVLLPGVLSRKAPNQNLSLWPIVLLNSSISLRVAGNIYSSTTNSSLPIWEALSGFLIIAAMILFMKNLHVSQNTRI